MELTIDGKPCVVDIVMAENGSCSILHDGNSYNAELIRGEGGKELRREHVLPLLPRGRGGHIAKYLRMKKACGRTPVG